MGVSGDSYADIEVEVLDADGVEELIHNALAEAGCTWDELQEQAKVGRFTDETAREAWLVVSTFALSA
ncbi:MAG: hypothetical protein OXD37_02055 [Acidimicrobiaceae bacterium]|nr:hypothetical protein [Acidimicrobiaceae bacterium]